MKASKIAEKTMNRTKSSKKCTPIKINDIKNPHIAKVGIHTFLNGEAVSVFDVTDYRVLNQIIGYAKFKNKNYGDVFYRGENCLHNTLLPSVSRQANNRQSEKELLDTIRKAIADEEFNNFAKLSGFKNQKNAKLIAEATLQHYGYSTHFIDVVDNHWVALWFGLNRFCKERAMKEYCFYRRRVINPIEVIKRTDTIEEDIYQYLVLIAVDNNIAPIERGLYLGNDVITIDLRSSLPSTFLRPHAQHGLSICRNRHISNEPYDLSKNVIAIIRLRIDRVSNWIGTGSLLSNENLFPAPVYDLGYEVLLQRKDLFENRCQTIATYI